MTAYRTNIHDSEPKVVIRNLLTTFGNFFSVLSFAILCFRWSLFSPQLFLFVYLYFFQHVRSVLREFLRMKKNRVLIRCHYSRRGYLSPASLRHFIEKLSLKNKILSYALTKLPLLFMKNNKFRNNSILTLYDQSRNQDIL